MSRDAFEALERQWESLTLNRYLAEEDEDELEEDAAEGDEDGAEPIVFRNPVPGTDAAMRSSLAA